MQELLNFTELFIPNATPRFKLRREHDNTHEFNTKTIDQSTFPMSGKESQAGATFKLTYSAKAEPHKAHSVTVHDSSQY